MTHEEQLANGDRLIAEMKELITNTKRRIDEMDNPHKEASVEATREQIEDAIISNLLTASVLEQSEIEGFRETLSNTPFQDLLITLVETHIMAEEADKVMVILQRICLN